MVSKLLTGLHNALNPYLPFFIGRQKRSQNFKRRLSLGVLILFILLLIFTRFYNLGETARFTRDESGDLLRIHQYYVDRELSLVGTISVENRKIYSSLIFYLIMPFAVMTDFDPIGPTYGMAFYGIITALVFIYLVKRINPELVIPAALLSLVWFPLLQTSRWYWNPHLIPLWVMLGLAVFFTRFKGSLLLSGFLLGLTMHQHYLAGISVGIFIATYGIYWLFKKQSQKALMLGVGFSMALSPLLLFDITHPPGIFMLNHFSDPPADVVRQSYTAMAVVTNTWHQIGWFLDYVAPAMLFAAVVGILTLFIIGLDIKNRSKALLFLPAWLFYLPVPGFFVLEDYRYFIPPAMFYIIWLFYQRDKLARKLAHIVIFLMLMAGLSFVGVYLTTTEQNGYINSVSKISQALVDDIQQNNFQMVNLAVLQSRDAATIGEKYRDLLIINQIKPIAFEQPQLAEHLYVITTGSEEAVMDDGAYQLNTFRNIRPTKIEVEGTGWRIFRLDR